MEGGELGGYYGDRVRCNAALTSQNPCIQYAEHVLRYHTVVVYIHTYVNGRLNGEAKSDKNFGLSDDPTINPVPGSIDLRCTASGAVTGGVSFAIRHPA